FQARFARTELSQQQQQQPELDVIAVVGSFQAARIRAPLDSLHQPGSETNGTQDREHETEVQREALAHARLFGAAHQTVAALPTEVLVSPERLSTRRSPPNT